MITRALISEARKFVRVPSNRVYEDLLNFLENDLNAINVKAEEGSQLIVAKKKIVDGIGITIKIRVLPEGKASAIEFNFSYRDFLTLVFASLVVIITICIIYLSAIPLFGIIPLILLMYNLGSGAGSFMTTINEFLLLLEKSFAQESLREVRRRWQTDSRSVDDIYRMLLDMHIRIWGDAHVLEYKISEYMREGLSREEAIRKIADDEGLS